MKMKRFFLCIASVIFSQIAQAELQCYCRPDIRPDRTAGYNFQIWVVGQAHHSGQDTLIGVGDVTKADCEARFEQDEYIKSRCNPSSN